MAFVKEKEEDIVIAKDKQSMWKLFRAFLKNKNTQFFLIFLFCLNLSFSTINATSNYKLTELSFRKERTTTVMFLMMPVMILLNVLCGSYV